MANSKDKTVQLKETGKVKITFEGMAVVEFCHLLYNGVEYYNRVLTESNRSEDITCRNFQDHAALQLLFGLYKKHFESGHMPDPMKVELSKPEAIMLWGLNQQLGTKSYSLMNIFLKLHQKLS